MNNAGWFVNNDDGDDGNWAAIGLKNNRRALTHLPGRAHPRAQGRRVDRGRVMRMLPGMRDHLRIGQPAQEQEADRQPDRNRFEGSS